MEKGMPRLDNFQIFVRRMYYQNCAERRENNQQPYLNWEEYLDKNEDFLKKLYKKKKNGLS